jgi:hypothetical protein
MSALPPLPKDGPTRLKAFALIALMAIGSIVLWLGVPFAWLYAVSHIYDSSTPSMGSFVMVLVGIPLSMVVVAKLLGRLNRIYGEITHTTPQVRVVLPWHRSLRAERDGGYPATVLDVVMVCSVALAVVCLLVWFVVAAGNPLPSN